MERRSLEPAVWFMVTVKNEAPRFEWVGQLETFQGGMRRRRSRLLAGVRGSGERGPDTILEQAPLRRDQVSGEIQ